MSETHVTWYENVCYRYCQYFCDLQSSFIVEWNAKFQLEVSKNEDVIFFFLIQVHRPSEFFLSTGFQASLDFHIETFFSNANII